MSRLVRARGWLAAVAPCAMALALAAAPVQAGQADGKAADGKAADGKAADGKVDYKPVTDQRLANPEPENWLQYRGNYQSWGYSPLDQITAKNVTKLVPAWSLSTGVSEGHQAPPIVNNGVMFVTTPQAQVMAINARTGEILWRYQKELPPELSQLHPTNRGVGLYGDNVYMTTTDSCVVALGATTGKVKWEQCVAPWKDGYYMTLSPLVAKGKVVVGVSGGEYGVRGFITALDAETGKEAWKTYTVAGPGDPAADTWKGDAWKTGGGSVWIQGSYDPAANLAYFGTGNGGPWTPDARPGDNLYTSSVVALDLDTGKIKGHHQYHWNDAWDWDEVSAPVLIDIERDGKKIPAAIHAGRNGYLWTLERSKDGPLSFVDGKPFVYQNVFSSLDPKTGRPAYDQSKIPGINRRAAFCPGLWGGKDWPPEAYNPKTGLFYIPSNDNLCSELAGAQAGTRKPGELYIGIPIDEVLNSLRLRDGVDTSKPFAIGAIQAWDPKTGKRVWQHDFQDSANWGPLLTTGSGLIFAGGTSDRKFRALDGTTGKVLWETRLNSGVTGVPSSYMIDGIQYVAVQAGWGVDAERMLTGINALIPEERRVSVLPQGGVIWVFRVMGEEAAAK